MDYSTGLLKEAPREVKEQVLGIYAEKAYRHFLDYCFYIDRNYLSPPHISYLIKKLEQVEKGIIRYLMIFMPPRHGKSETVSRKFPAWYLGKHPDDNIILSSYAYTLAKGFSKEVRDAIESRLYKTIFPIGTKDDSRAVNDWDIANHKGGMVTSGVGGSITGYGANLLIIDDPFKNQEEAESEVIREKVWEWYRSVILTRLEPGARIILIMTRWHRKDLAGKILEEDAASWDVVDFPAIAEKEDILGRNIGQALWPERYDEKTLAVTKLKVGTRIWNALFQQHPMDIEGSKFKREWFRMYNELPKEAFALRRGGGIDTATSLKSASDNTALVDVCRDKDKFLYVDDVFCEKITVSGFSRYLSNQHKFKRYARVKLESNNAGEAIKQRIDEIGREEGTMPPVVTEATSTDKMVRAMEFQHLVENGTLRFKAGNPKVAALIEHLINFDGKGADIDDDVDALGFAIKAVNSDDEGDIQIADWDIRGRR